MTDERKEQLASQEAYSFEDFEEIIACLRSPQGCPWDREQTHRSLMPCMMEEAAEVLAAIRIMENTGEYGNLSEELGDVLLQVVMHAEIAAQENHFTMEDVITEVSRKMIRRHPHVFGNQTAVNGEQVLDRWEDIKRKEKENHAWVENPLLDIPRELPAFVQAMKVHKRLEKHYRQQTSLEESLGEMSINLEKLAKEEDLCRKNQLIGDILYEMANVSNKCGVSGEMALLDKVEKEISTHSIKT